MKSRYSRDFLFEVNWKTEILPEAQRALLPELKHTPSGFVLYGGTAIALRLGHRESVDFDFFSAKSFDPDKLYNSIRYLAGAEVFQSAPNTLSATVYSMDQPVKFSFFGGLANLRQIEEPDKLASARILVASLIDLFGMKCATIFNRIEKKDYVDIYEIISSGGLRLEDGLKAAMSIYGSNQYSPLLTKKALTFFEDGDLDSLPSKIKAKLIEAVKSSKNQVVLPFDELKEIGYESGSS